MTARPDAPVSTQAAPAVPRFLVPCAWASLATGVLCTLYVVVDLSDGVPSFAQLYYVWLPIIALLVLQVAMLLLFVCKRAYRRERRWKVFFLLFSPVLVYAIIVVFSWLMIFLFGASKS